MRAPYLQQQKRIAAAVRAPMASQVGRIQKQLGAAAMPHTQSLLKTAAAASELKFGALAAARYGQAAKAASKPPAWLAEAAKANSVSPNSSLVRADLRPIHNPVHDTNELLRDFERQKEEERAEEQRRREVAEARADRAEKRSKYMFILTLVSVIVSTSIAIISMLVP